jgi:hypothetical protein
VNNNLSFGGGGNFEYLPKLSDGTNLKLKILSSPEKYDHPEYGTKYKLDIIVLKINSGGEEIAEKEYSVDSSANCWKGLYLAWISTGKTQSDWIELAFGYEWLLTAKMNKSGKMPYKLTAIPQEPIEDKRLEDF